MINKVRNPKSTIIKKPKPKPKGKGKDKKIKKAAAKKFDIFETLLESDAGADSSKQDSSLYEEEIEKLSKAQLTRLEKKIQRIRQSSITTKKQNKTKEKRFSQILRWIEDRYRCCKVQEEILLKTIRKKVNKLKIKKASTEDKFLIEGELYGIRKLASSFFEQELLEIELLLQQGLLLKEKQNQGKLSIFKNYIHKILNIN